MCLGSSLLILIFKWHGKCAICWIWAKNSLPLLYMGAILHSSMFAWDEEELEKKKGYLLKLGPVLEKLHIRWVTIAGGNTVNLTVPTLKGNLEDLEGKHIEVWAQWLTEKRSQSPAILSFSVDEIIDSTSNTVLWPLLGISCNALHKKYLAFA